MQSTSRIADATLQTRLGTVFPPSFAAPFRAQQVVDFAALLQASTALESINYVEGDRGSPMLPPESTSKQAASPSSPPPLPPSKKRPASEESSGPEKATKQSRSNFNRRKKRNAAFHVGGSGHTPSERTLRDAAVTAASIPTTLRTEDLPVKHGAYTAQIAKLADPQRVWSVDDLIEAGFELVEWDGR